MKIEELKLGDWVMFEYTSVQIKAIHGNNEVDIAKGDEIATVDIRTLEPIPLTKEILGKNGWKKCKIATSRWLYSYKRKDYPRLNVEKEGFSFHCMDKDIGINAIHELQHLLWALGIDDDLKI